MSLLFGRAGTEKVDWQAGEQAGAVAAGAIGIDTAAVREALQGLQGVLAGCREQAGPLSWAMKPVPQASWSGWPQLGWRSLDAGAGQLHILV